MTLRGRVRLAVLLVCGAAPAQQAVAQQSVPRVGLGWGVDTAAAAWSEHAWHAAVPEIYRLWAGYLRSGPERQEPTDRWSAAEQRAGPVYDHTAGTAYKGFPATVLDIRPVAPEQQDTFVIRTLFAGAADGVVRPVALTRVYAFREGDRWVLGSALPRHVREHQATSIGTFRFLTPRARPLDRPAAVRAVAFADSLADAFGVERLRDVTYVVASSPEALHRVMGIDWTFGGMGHGYALPGLVLSGDAAFGEENRHEITHLVLQPLVREARTHGLVAEGIAAWYGGSSGRTYAMLRREYAAYLADNPDVTLDTLLEGGSPDRGWAAAGAVLVDMVHARRGTPGVLQLLRTGRASGELRAGVAALLGVPWAEVARMWRSRATG